MGPFLSSFRNLDILLEVDYVSKWVATIACPINDASTVVRFIQIEQIWSTQNNH